MKVKVNNLSSGLLALPAPLLVTLAAGRGATLSLSEPEWKAVCSSPAIARLVQTRMLSMGVVQEAPPAAKPQPVVSAPAVEAPKAPEPPAPVVEPRSEEWEPTPEQIGTIVSAYTAAEEDSVSSTPEPAPEAPVEEPVEAPVEAEPEALAADVKKKKKKN